jgi:uncharacterized protein (DUF305 family)
MTTSKRLTTAALSLAGALVLTACGGGDDTATTDSGSSMGGMDHGGATASSTPSTGAEASAMGNDADVAFLTGMKPHHEQAVEMSDMVLAADPPAPVAELARQVKAAQGPEIEQMDQMLADLGQEAGGDSMSGSMMDHGGMMSDADMEELMNATGTDAARMYLEGMIEHHKGAIDAAETEVAKGEYPPAVELAEKIAKDQAAEIARMEGLLAAL